MQVGEGRCGARSLSSCLYARMNSSWLVGRCASVVMSRWESMEIVLHDESSHACNIKNTGNGFEDVVAQARACWIVFHVTIGLYSGLARHEPVHR